MGQIIIDRALFLTANGDLVEEGDPQAATAWAIEGSTRSEADAKRLGYKPKSSKKSKAAPANKSKAAPAEDKSADTVCPECGFEAKTAGGLASHQRSHDN